VVFAAAKSTQVDFAAAKREAALSVLLQQMLVRTSQTDVKPFPNMDYFLGDWRLSFL
jgi:hypothetical protein